MASFLQRQRALTYGELAPEGILQLVDVFDELAQKRPSTAARAPPPPPRRASAPATPSSTSGRAWARWSSRWQC